MLVVFYIDRIFVALPILDYKHCIVDLYSALINREGLQARGRHSKTLGFEPGSPVLSC